MNVSTNYLFIWFCLLRAFSATARVIYKQHWKELGLHNILLDTDFPRARLTVSEIQQSCPTIKENKQEAKSQLCFDLTLHAAPVKVRGKGKHIFLLQQFPLSQLSLVK